jgi:hypothetical protein
MSSQTSPIPVLFTPAEAKHCPCSHYSPSYHNPPPPHCDTFARLGRSPCFHFKPLGLSRHTTKSCVAICSLLCSFFIPYVLLPFTCSPSGSRTFYDMHSHWTSFHLELYLHSPAACHSQRRLRTSTICQPVAVLTPPYASYHFHASFTFTCFYVYCSRVVLGHFLCV